MDEPLPPADTATLRRWRLGALGLALGGLLLTAVVWRGLGERLDHAEEEAYERFRTHVAARLDERMRHHLGVLAAFEGLFAASDEVTRRDFHEHHRRVVGGGGLPGLRVVQFAPRIRGGELAAHEATVRADRSLQPEGYPEFRVRPPGQRDEYWPITYNEPMSGNEVAFGFDGRELQGLRELTERAIEEGSPQASRPRELLQGGFGFVVRAAVYRGGQPVASAAQRRAAFAGYLSAVYEVRPMLADLISGGDQNRYRVWIADIGTVQPDGARGIEPLTLFDSAGADRPLGDDAQRSDYAQPVAGRLWQISIWRDPVPGWRQPLPLAIGVGGALLSLALAGVLWLVGGRYQQAARLAHRMSEEARSTAQRLRGVIDHSADGIVTLDAAGRVLSCNPAAERMFGAPAPGQPFTDWLLEPTQDQVRAWLSEPLAEGHSRSDDHLHGLRPDGTAFPLEAVFTAMETPHGRQLVGMLRDVSERHEARDRILHIAHHDELTKLPNRSLLQKWLQDAVGHAHLAAEAGLSRHLAVLFIDLDRFKTINDSLGHDTGDQVLQQVAGRLKRAVRGGDLVARMGGDEFVVVLSDLPEARAAEAIAKKILEAMVEPVQLDSGQRLRVTPSIGIAAYPDAGEDARALMSSADMAMYRAKQAGRNTFRMAPGAETGGSRRLRLENELPQAVDQNELYLLYQPQYDLRDGRIVGAEALVRWRHPELGVISPVDFIPIAEETGEIVRIGRWVLREACREARAWQQRCAAAGRAPLRIAVNLSPRQMEDEHLVKDVVSALLDTGLDAPLLELEITEGAVVRDIKRAGGVVERLHGLHATVAIDDFGVGESSLEHLRDLPIQKFKIDRGFVRPLPGKSPDERAVRLVTGLIALARGMGLGLVAEGVENQAQYDFLRAHGCETAQGYLMSPPVDAVALWALVAAQLEGGSVAGKVVPPTGIEPVSGA